MTATMSLPSLTDLLPHRPPLLLLSSLERWEGETVTCCADATATQLFAEQGQVPALVSLEYMAQAAAVHRGLQRQSTDGPAGLGYLVGVTQLKLHRAELPPASDGKAELFVGATCTWSAGRAARYQCRVWGAEGAIAEAELTVQTSNVEATK